MKNKFLMSALALTASFAACTNEELPNVVENNVAGEKEVVGANLVSNGGGISINGVESRVNSQGWEGADKLALAWFNLSGNIYDDQRPESMGSDLRDNRIFANHLFAYNKETQKFETNSNIYQGGHFIYFPYEYKTKVEVMEVNVNAASQTTEISHDLINKALYISAKDFIAEGDVDPKTGKLVKDFYITPAVNALKVNVTPETAIAGNNFFKNLEISKLDIWNQDALFRVKGTVDPHKIPSIVVENNAVNPAKTYKNLKENLAQAITTQASDYTTNLTTNIDADITLANASALRAFTLPTAATRNAATWTAFTVEVVANGEEISYPMGKFLMELPTTNEKNVEALEKLQAALYTAPNAEVKAFYLQQNMNTEANLAKLNLDVDLLAADFQPDYTISNLEEWNLTVKMVDAFNSLRETPVQPEFILTGSVCVTEGKTLDVPAAGLKVKTEATGAQVCFETDYTVDATLAKIFDANDNVVVKNGVTLSINGTDADNRTALVANIENNGVIVLNEYATVEGVDNNARIVVAYGSYVAIKTGADKGVIAFNVLTDTEAYKINNLISNNPKFLGHAFVNMLIVNENNVLNLVKKDGTSQNYDPYTGKVINGGAVLADLKNIDIEMNGGTIEGEQEHSKSVKSIKALTGSNTINDVNIMGNLVVKNGATATIDATEHLHGKTLVKHNMIINGNIDNEGTITTNVTINTTDVDNEKGHTVVSTGNTIWYTGTYTQGGKAEGSILKTNKGVSIITVPVSDQNTPEQNKDAAVASFATASEGSIVNLPSAEFKFDATYNFGGTSAASAPVSIVGATDTKIISNTSLGRTFYFTLSDSSKDILLKNLTIVNENASNAKACDIWVRPDNCSKNSIVNIVLENVTCDNVMLECAYVDGITYNVELINCNIKRVSADAFKKESVWTYNTHLNVTVDGGNVNIVKGGNAPENVTITKK